MRITTMWLRNMAGDGEEVADFGGVVEGVMTAKKLWSVPNVIRPDYLYISAYCFWLEARVMSPAVATHAANFGCENKKSGGKRIAKTR